MDGKYKIYLGRREENFINVVSTLIESGLYVFSYMRLKSLQEIRKFYGSPRNGDLRDFLDYSEWLVINYHEECKRVVAAVESDWYSINQYQQITLEDFLKLVEKEKEEVNAARGLQTQV